MSPNILGLYWGYIGVAPKNGKSNGKENGK